MNSNYDKSTKPVSLNTFDFDLGIGSNRPKSLNDQKTKTPSSYTSSSFGSTQSKPNTASSWQPRPSWSHQPAPTQPAARPGAATVPAPTSMVGDIFGKSWGSTSATTSNAPAAAASIGIVNKNPNLFGDLVNSALGQNKGNSNVPLKSATANSGPGSNKGVYSMGNLADSLPKTGNSGNRSSDWGSSESFGSYTSSNKNTTSNNNKGMYSMGNMADSLPKTGNSVKGSGDWGSSESFGSYTSASKNSNISNANTMKSGNLGGSSIGNLGGGMGANKDPFGSLAGFGSKPAGGMSSVGKGKASSGGDGFGEFQNASKSSTPAFMADPFPEIKKSSMGLNSGDYSKLDDFAIPKSQNQPPVQLSGLDAFDTLFTPSSASAGGPPKGSVEGLASEQFSGTEDWGFDSNDTGGTTELDGLPPPPAGVSASAAKVKGMDSYKQGQYPDAIKWLSWAVILLEKVGDDDATKEVLSSRASCYKEVGEYKKAVADCTKVLENDGENVAVLVQRALLYESMEKYRLGAEDLRTVMKLDPGNRVARSTIHRLTKMAE
ncbi:hypothetical protein RHGRI_012620 [Rhododendron griersonianum]|uniref:Uncharacterized protein n=1 Tax=Rhododendron griersonianum TaxID=479676 RepID=A0AAV6KR69_9ERIC|nr:hypothetical protein RHGRI_012620 [Rhododendron griersonianum]KAG5555145.1 hypothetical protein RHGRI_012620 [Rhododendron griersonianum]